MEKFTFKHKETGKTLHEVEAKSLIYALCDAVKNGVDLKKINNGYYDFIYSDNQGYGSKDNIKIIHIKCNCRELSNFHYTSYLIENNGSLFVDPIGRSEFDFIARYSDDSTVILINKKYSLIEKYGNFFEWQGKDKFDRIHRLHEYCTQVTIFGKTYSVVRKPREKNILIDKENKTSKPSHYDLNPEPIDVIQNWNLNFNLGNVIKYVARCGKKQGESKRGDLEKAKVYLEKEILNWKDFVSELEKEDDFRIAY